jgi:hypothetical protein
MEEKMTMDMEKKWKQGEEYSQPGLWSGQTF